MGITRECSACENKIDRDTFIEISFRVLKTNEGESQDAKFEFYDSYCDSCIENGRAIKDMINYLDRQHKYKLLNEPSEQKSDSTS